MIKNEPVQASQPVRPLLILKYILVLISVFWGSFGLTFFFIRQNVSAASSSLVLLIVSFMQSHFTYTVMKGRLHEKYNLSRLKFVFIVSIVIGVAQLVGAISYAALGAMNHQDFQLEGYGYYVAIIPSSLASLWSFLLAYETRSYMGEFSMAATNMAQF